MLHIVMALVILVHGLGHVLFLVPLLGMAEWGQSTESWLIRTETTTKLLGSVLWLGAIVLFTAAAVALFGLDVAWRPAAIAASIVSLFGVALFWDSSNSAAAVFAASVDVTLLMLVILAGSTTTRIIGI